MINITEFKGIEKVKREDFNNKIQNINNNFTELESIKADLSYLQQNYDRKLVNSINLYVSPSGDDTTGDGSEAKPYKTIQKSLDVLPKNLGGNDVTITVSSGTYDSNMVIKGFCNGTININGATDLDNSLNYKIGYIQAIFNSCSIGITGFNIVRSDSDGINISIFKSQVFLNFCTMISNNLYGLAIRKAETSASNCSISNKTNCAITAFDNSIASLYNITGGNNVIGIKSGSSSLGGGIIFKENINIGAETSEVKFAGGQIFE